MLEKLDGLIETVTENIDKKHNYESFKGILFDKRDTSACTKKPWVTLKKKFILFFRLLCALRQDLNWYVKIRRK